MVVIHGTVRNDTFARQPISCHLKEIPVIKIVSLSTGVTRVFVLLAFSS